MVKIARGKSVVLNFIGIIMLSELSIQNYKSIKKLDLDCKRINLFIGRPNVGKSNILEAISLLSGGVGEHIRKEDFRNMFFD